MEGIRGLVGQEGCYRGVGAARRASLIDELGLAGGGAKPGHEVRYLWADRGRRSLCKHGVP